MDYLVNAENGHLLNRDLSDLEREAQDAWRADRAKSRGHLNSLAANHHEVNHRPETLARQEREATYGDWKPNTVCDKCWTLRSANGSCGC